MCLSICKRIYVLIETRRLLQSNRRIWQPCVSVVELDRIIQCYTSAFKAKWQVQSTVYLLIKAVLPTGRKLVSLHGSLQRTTEIILLSICANS